MNSAQITNLVTTVVQSLLGMLVAKGLISGSESDSIGGAIAALVVFFITHKWNSASTSPPSSGGSNGGKSVLLPLLAVAFLSVGMVGCSTTTPQAAAYETVGTASVTVQSALAAYDQFAAAGKTTPAENAEVQAAYEKYQAAFSVVCDAGAVYSATSGTNAPAASLALETAVTNASQTITDLVSLVESFGVTVTN